MEKVCTNPKKSIKIIKNDAGDLFERSELSEASANRRRSKMSEIDVSELLPIRFVFFWKYPENYCIFNQVFVR